MLPDLWMKSETLEETLNFQNMQKKKLLKVQVAPEKKFIFNITHFRKLFKKK